MYCLESDYKRSREGSKESNSRTKNRPQEDIRRTTEVQQNSQGRTKEEEQATPKKITEGPKTDHKMTRQTTEGHQKDHSRTKEGAKKKDRRIIVYPQKVCIECTERISNRNDRRKGTK